MHRDRYVSDDGFVIVLEVPESMGSGSGYIPPPFIEFWREGAAVRFTYQGSE